MGFAVGEWIASHTQVLEVLEGGQGFEAYRVLHGDAVPREIVLHRYRVRLPLDSATLRSAARDLPLYELRVVGDLDDAILELYGDSDAVERFRTRYHRRWPR
ncbi:MAG TPA: hypothetical protein VL326_27535 [Kofleriaceae bacterium]|jgi:hypothetical protein|nr:hypothetical protein [Kofleriaceae bacterium]